MACSWTVSFTCSSTFTHDSNQSHSIDYDSTGNPASPALLLSSSSLNPPRGQEDFLTWAINNALYPLPPIFYPRERTAGGWSIPGDRYGAPKIIQPYRTNRDDGTPQVALHTLSDGRQYGLVLVILCLGLSIVIQSYNTAFVQIDSW
jgi:hypothetical protein